MRTIAPLALLVACAASRPTPPRPLRTECTIAQPTWANAEDDYDRQATIEALTALERVIADAASVGPEEVARRLDQLFRRPPSTFVSRWTVDAALRLRQLACAHQTGKLSQAEADQRYVQVINDIEDERAVIVDELRRRAP